MTAGAEYPTERLEELSRSPHPLVAALATAYLDERRMLTRLLPEETALRLRRARVERALRTEA